jgi:hypothetical protein
VDSISTAGIMEVHMKIGHTRDIKKNKDTLNVSRGT